MARQVSGQEGSGVGIIAEPMADPLLGTVVGSYELVERLGADGDSTVYRAEHRLLGYERALRLLPAHIDGDEGYPERFVREAKRAAGLHHPGIVRIHDVGMDERFCYVVMDLVDGASLAELLRAEAPLGTARALTLLTQAAAALDHAHMAEVPHGDLTASAIVVGSNARLRLVDFGTARALGSIAAPDPVFELVEAIRADQEALGALAHDLLAGQPPSADAEPQRDDDASPDGPPRQAPSPSHEPRPPLSKAVEGVLRRQRSAEPDERFATSSEFVAALRAACEARPPRPEPAEPDATDATDARPQDPWALLQSELRAAHHSRGGDRPDTVRTPRRAFLVRTSAAVAGVVIAGGSLSLVGTRLWSSDGAATTPAPKSGPVTATPSKPTVATQTPVVEVSTAASRDGMPASLVPGEGSVLLQGLRMEMMGFYRSTGGGIVMQGLLVNPGDTVVAIDGFSLTFVNAAGVALRTVSVTTGPYFVQPGLRAPWLQLVDRDLPPFSQVRVTVKASAGRGSVSSKTQAFDVSDQQVAGGSGSDGSWSLIGRVTNRGTTGVNGVSILVATFDDTGTLLRVGSASASITRLARGESSMFKVNVEAPAAVARHEVLVQGS